MPCENYGVASAANRNLRPIPMPTDWFQFAAAPKGGAERQSRNLRTIPSDRFRREERDLTCLLLFVFVVK